MLNNIIFSGLSGAVSLKLFLFFLFLSFFLGFFLAMTSIYIYEEVIEKKRNKGKVSPSVVIRCWLQIIAIIGKFIATIIVVGFFLVLGFVKGIINAKRKNREK